MEILNNKARGDFLHTNTQRDKRLKKEKEALNSIYFENIYLTVDRLVICEKKKNGSKKNKVLSHE